jgi:hypothetical protein
MRENDRVANGRARHVFNLTKYMHTQKNTLSVQCLTILVSRKHVETED